LDVVRIKVKHNGQIITKAVYLAIAVTMEGIKDVLGMCAAETEGAKFWLSFLTELKNRGVKDILIACVFDSVKINHILQSKRKRYSRSRSQPRTDFYQTIHPWGCGRTCEGVVFLYN
jgi:transposase-like protein